MRIGYTAVAATERFVFVLFSGKTRRGFDKTATFANYLHVYDWDGNMLRVFRVDDNLGGLAVEPDGSRFYALRHDPLPAVMVYDLPPLGSPK